MKQNMARSCQWLACLTLTLVLPCMVSAQEGEDPIAGFVKHVQESELESGQKDAIAAEVQELAGDPYTKVDAITIGLGRMFPEYKNAVEGSFSEDADAIGKLRTYVDSDNKFLAADSSFFLARLMMNGQQFDEALPLLEKLNGELAGYTLQSSNSLFFMGVAQAGLLENQKAIASFSEFLEQAADAPERLRVSAWRQIQQLQMIREGQLEDVHQRMVFSENRLKQQKSGDLTQDQQSKIVDMLAKLIKEQEQKECSNCKSNCNKPGEKQANKPSQGQGQQQSAGKSNQGGSSSNPNGVVRREFDDGPASPWSRLRDRSRDAANTAIKEKLPSKYREIVEKYSSKARGDDN